MDQSEFMRDFDADLTKRANLSNAGVAGPPDLKGSEQS